MIRKKSLIANNLKKIKIIFKILLSIAINNLVVRIVFAFLIYIYKNNYKKFYTFDLVIFFFLNDYADIYFFRKNNQPKILITKKRFSLLFLNLNKIKLLMKTLMFCKWTQTYLQLSRYYLYI